MTEGTAYYNGVVYTADAKMPEAEAFIIENGRFTAVGKNEIATDCRHSVDLGGKCVIPGLIDAHCHILAAVKQSETDMLLLNEETKPEELGKELLRLLSVKGIKEQDTAVTAMASAISEKGFRARDIDCAINNRPVIVFDSDGHSLLLNSRAMELLGLDRDTKDPSDGSYFKRYENGGLTGLVIEIPAMMLCRRLLDDESSKDTSEIIHKTLQRCSALGYTTVFEAMSVDDGNTGIFEALKSLDDSGRMPVRLAASLCYHGEGYIKADEAIGYMKALREGFTTRHILPGTLKMITDGTVEEHSALLYEDYADEPGHSGSELLPEADMLKMAHLAAAEGFNIHIHAIGDRAAGRALNVLCGLGSISGTKTIAHNQLYKNTDIERFARAGDIFFQTTSHWVQRDENTLKILGEERYKRQFPIATMIKKGVTVSFGSDSCLEPVTSNAFLGMYYAEARGVKGFSEALCFPPLEEGITRKDALYAYTINGARQLGVADATGSISAGKSADFLILNRDMMKCSLEELKDTRVEATYFEGERR